MRRCGRRAGGRVNTGYARCAHPALRSLSLADALRAPGCGLLASPRVHATPDHPPVAQCRLAAPDHPSRQLSAAALCALILFCSSGCARKLPPSGGPPDLEPPVVLSVTPDSSATAVSRTARLVIEFSEGMDPVS